MKNDLILLIEPSSGPVRKMPLLGGLYEISAVSNPKVAVEALDLLTPQVILIAMAQSRSDGLSICRVIRRRVGPGPLIVLFGRPTPEQRLLLLQDSLSTLRRRWGFDRLLSGEPSLSVLEQVIREHLASRTAPAAVPAAAPAPTEDHPRPAPRRAPPAAASMTAPVEVQLAAAAAAASLSRRDAPRRQRSWGSQLIGAFRSMVQANDSVSVSVSP